MLRGAIITLSIAGAVFACAEPSGPVSLIESRAAAVNAQSAFSAVTQGPMTKPVGCAAGVTACGTADITGFGKGSFEFTITIAWMRCLRRRRRILVARRQHVDSCRNRNGVRTGRVVHTTAGARWLLRQSREWHRDMDCGECQWSVPGCLRRRNELVQTSGGVAARRVHRRAVVRFRAVRRSPSWLALCALLLAPTSASPSAAAPW